MKHLNMDSFWSDHTCLFSIFSFDSILSKGQTNIHSKWKCHLVTMFSVLSRIAQEELWLRWNLGGTCSNRASTPSLVMWSGLSL